MPSMNPPAPRRTALAMSIDLESLDAARRHGLKEAHDIMAKHRDRSIEDVKRHAAPLAQGRPTRSSAGMDAADDARLKKARTLGADASSSSTSSSSLEIEIIKPGSCGQGAKLAERVRREAVLVVAPVLTQQGFGELVAQKGVAGFQERKQRGTFQSISLDTLCNHARIALECLDELEETSADLGEWLEATHDVAAGNGEMINWFLNFNRGDQPAEGGDGENDGFHKDKPTDPDRNTGRVKNCHGTVCTEKSTPHSHAAHAGDYSTSSVTQLPVTSYSRYTYSYWVHL